MHEIMLRKSLAYHVGFEGQWISRLHLLTLPIDVSNGREKRISVIGQTEKIQVEAVRLINHLDNRLEERDK